MAQKAKFVQVMVDTFFITATDCDTVRRSWIFDAGIKRKVAKGKRCKERPDSPWAEEIVRGTTNAFGGGMETTDSFCLIPLRIIQEGRTMDWERVRLARGVWRPAKHIFVQKCGARRPAQRPGRSRSLKKIIRNIFGKGLFFRNISENFPIIRNFTPSVNPAFLKGRKMDWERVRLARGVWRPARHIFVRKCGASRPAQRPGRSRSPDIPKLPFGATKRAHWRSLAQRAKFVQVMVETFFKTRNLCKHWSKRVSGSFLSSMFWLFQPRMARISRMPNCGKLGEPRNTPSTRTLCL